MIRNIFNWLYVIFHPSYWLMNNDYCEVWDKTLNDLMEWYDFQFIDKYTASIGNIVIWITNHPYSSFIPYPFPSPKLRAKRTTIYKAYKKFTKDTEVV